MMFIVPKDRPGVLLLIIEMLSSLIDPGCASFRIGAQSLAFQPQQTIGVFL